MAVAAPTTAPGFRVTIEDLAKGTKEEVMVPLHGWYLVTTGRLHVAGEQYYTKTGTTILTIKRDPDWPAPKERR